MNSISYVFLIKDEIIVPQSLDDEYCGQIIASLVEQGFFLSDVNHTKKDVVQSALNIIIDITSGDI